MEIEVLLEYKGSKRTIKCSIPALSEQILSVLGLPDASFSFTQSTSDLILQRFSSTLSLM